jgi:hypothetical protein
MVCISVFFGLDHTLAHAIQLCHASPAKRRKAAVCLKEVLLGIIGHFEPIDAANIFALANDLANKAFNGIQWRFSNMISLFSRLYTFQRKQQTTVQIKADMGMIHPWFALDHSILIIAEMDEPLVEKLCQCKKRWSWVTAK